MLLPYSPEVVSDPMKETEVTQNDKTYFSSTLDQAANHRNRFNSHCSVSSAGADSSKSRNSSFFVFYWNSPPPKGQGVTDCIVFAPLHTLGYCWVHSESNGPNVLYGLVTKSSLLLFLELRFLINVKHLFIWVSVYNMLGEERMKSLQKCITYTGTSWNMIIFVTIS